MAEPVTERISLDKLRAMPREHLEQLCLRGAAHCDLGGEIIEAQGEAIEWLGVTASRLCDMLAKSDPELTDDLATLKEAVVRVSRGPFPPAT